MKTLQGIRNVKKLHFYFFFADFYILKQLTNLFICFL